MELMASEQKKRNNIHAIHNAASSKCNRIGVLSVSTIEDVSEVNYPTMRTNVRYVMKSANKPVLIY